MIDEIESRRKALRIEQKELCQRAGVHETTYLRIKKGESSGQGATFSRLMAALSEFEQERAA